MVQYLKTSDILLQIYNNNLPTKKYMSPLKLFEYMASKKPIIASDFPVLKEILRNNYNAVCIEPENYSELVKSIKKIISDDKFSKFISTNAFDDVKNKTWVNRAKHIITKIQQ